MIDKLWQISQKVDPQDSDLLLDFIIENRDKINEIIDSLKPQESEELLDKLKYVGKKSIEEYLPTKSKESETEKRYREALKYLLKVNHFHPKTYEAEIKYIAQNALREGDK